MDLGTLIALMCADQNSWPSIRQLDQSHYFWDQGLRYCINQGPRNHYGALSSR